MQPIHELKHELDKLDERTDLISAELTLLLGTMMRIRRLLQAQRKLYDSEDPGNLIIIELGDKGD